MFLNPIKSKNTYNGANFFVIVTMNRKNTRYQRGNSLYTQILKHMVLVLLIIIIICVVKE